MTRYEFRRAPNPRRVRFFMAEKQIDPSTVETTQIDIAAGRMNPISGVPVLELDDGTYLSETMAIGRYFDALYPAPPLLGSSALEPVNVSSERLSSRGRSVSCKAALARNLDRP